jgi:hypothetical protein
MHHVLAIFMQTRVQDVLYWTSIVKFHTLNLHGSAAAYLASLGAGHAGMRFTRPRKNYLPKCAGSFLQYVRENKGHTQYQL